MSRKLNFPHKPLRIINPFKPGGFSDTIVEKMTPKFSELLGQEIEVEYRHGFPGGCVAPEYVATSEPDGHTLLIGTIGNIALLPTIYPGYKIDPLIDLAPITLLAQAADILVTHPTAPFSTFEEMCDFAKENPGKLTWNAINPGSIHYLEMKLLMRDAGIELAEPKFGGNPFEDILSASVDLFISTPPNIIPRINEGRLKALGVCARESSQALPDVPALTTLNCPAMHTGSWTGLFAPAGTPPEIIDIISQMAREAVAEPAVIEATSKVAMTLSTQSSPAEFVRYLKSETARLAAAVEEVGIPIL